MATTHIPNRSGWLPHPDDIQRWLEQKIHDINKKPNKNRPWNDVIIEFQHLIENDPEIYMGFNMMFKQTEQSTDPRGKKQVCDIFSRIP
jgi:phosphatidylserine decarboxylase